nr:FUSC family protein [Propionicimonas sp.]
MNLVARIVRRLLPPSKALVVAVMLLAPLAVATTAMWMLAGVVVTLAFLMGVTAGIPAATASTAPAVKGAAGVLCVAAAVGGALAGAQPPIASAVLIAGLSIAQGPLTQRVAGIGIFAPVLAAVFSSVAFSSEPWLLGVGVAVGYVFVIVLALILKLPRTVSPVARTVAWRHALVFAALAGPASWLTRSLDLGHGYWLVLALAAVLRPAPDDSRIAARSRMTGTVTGVVLAIGIVMLLPGPVALAAAAACTLLATGWGVAQDVERQALFSTPVVLLLGSGGSLGDGVGLGIERLWLTAAAAVLAVVAAAVIDRFNASVAAVSATEPDPNTAPTQPTQP